MSAPRGATIFPELGLLKARVGEVFSRIEVRTTAGAFIDGLLSGAERKTGWLLSEQAGFERPYRMQSLLGPSSWSADALRDVVRGYVFEALGDPDGVLIVDETGFVKKGAHSVGGRGNIRERLAGSRIRRWACSWRMQAALGRC